MSSTLVSINCAANMLNGTIPTGLYRLTNLDLLRLERNELTGIFAIGDNKITGTLFSALLQLSRNDLTGSIPKSWGRLSNLHYLFLDGNNLSGSVPNSLCSGSSSHELEVDPGMPYFRTASKRESVMRDASMHCWNAATVPFSVGFRELNVSI
eukprot:scaffold31886_cov66-Attheya_sp.AAC.12